MATTQQGAVAAGFIHALRDPAVLAKWNEAKENQEQLCGLIRDTLGLAETPSKSDLDAMKEHAEATLQNEHAALKAVQPKAPHTVGYGFSVQS